MNGVHDMGGLECFGPIENGPDEKFHHDWERQVLAITLAVGATGTWNLDQSRFSRESLDPSLYLSAGYYGIWLNALESLLLKHGLLSQAELNSGKAEPTFKTVNRVLEACDVEATLNRGSPVNRPATTSALFSVGDQVRVINLHTPTHTRLPAYIRNHTGIVHKVHDPHVYPDTHALGKGENPQWLYNIQFNAKELWGEHRRQHDVVHVDCWEPYLEGI